MLKPKYHSKFKKDILKAEKRGKDLSKLIEIMDLLIREKPLEKKHKNHKLKGNHKQQWECHIEPDWLLVYEKTNTEIYFVKTGSHSDIF